jgi:FkbM family methyltransferase
VVEYVLYGAGATGKYVADRLKPECFVFADNDRSSTSLRIGDRLVPILTPDKAQAICTDATWIACALSLPAAPEIRKDIKRRGVNTTPLWSVCDLMKMGVPSEYEITAIRNLFQFTIRDWSSQLEFNEQIIFRRAGRIEEQLLKPSPIGEMYFPPFIRKLDDEVFVDCGANNGDTIKPFMEQWPAFKSIIAFEPDQENYNKLIKTNDPESCGRITHLRMAVSDHDGEVSFTCNNDWSSHLGGESNTKVRAVTLDHFLGDIVPTLIKMDVEGHERQALWGARRILAEHKPVLAICAYHHSEDLWAIPLLIHALQPEYELRLARYAEGSTELVWYAIPPDRVVAL